MLFLMILFVLLLAIIFIFSFIIYDLHFGYKFDIIYLNLMGFMENSFIFIYIYAYF